MTEEESKQVLKKVHHQLWMINNYRDQAACPFCKHVRTESDDQGELDVCYCNLAIEEAGYSLEELELVDEYTRSDAVEAALVADGGICRFFEAAVPESPW